jgi:nucleotide-binding universal stress UspA family protein
MFRRILVGWDGTEAAGHAMRVAVELAAGLGSEVVALSVLELSRHGDPEEDQDRADETARRVAAERLTDYRLQAGSSGVPLSHQFILGERSEEVLASHAADHGFDLLVVGRHGGHSPVCPGGAGPVTENLLIHAPCPLLVVGPE